MSRPRASAVAHLRHTLRTVFAREQEHSSTANDLLLNTLLDRFLQADLKWVTGMRASWHK